jgi:hypothetical protein
VLSLGLIEQCGDQCRAYSLALPGRLYAQRRYRDDIGASGLATSADDMADHPLVINGHEFESGDRATETPGLKNDHQLRVVLFLQRSRRQCVARSGGHDATPRPSLTRILTHGGGQLSRRRSAGLSRR